MVQSTLNATKKNEIKKKIENETNDEPGKGKSKKSKKNHFLV